MRGVESTFSNTIHLPYCLHGGRDCRAVAAAGSQFSLIFSSNQKQKYTRFAIRINSRGEKATPYAMYVSTRPRSKLAA